MVCTGFSTDFAKFEHAAASKRHSEALAERDSKPNAVSAMSDGADKLRALAEQSRMLCREAIDKERAKSLQCLANLYEQQAADLDHGLAALDSVASL